MLLQATQSALPSAVSNTSTVPPSWMIEPPLSTIYTPSPLTALIRARYLLLQVTTLCSCILSAHIVASAIRQSRFACIGRSDVVPVSEWRRSMLYALFVGTTTTVFVLVGILATRYEFWNPWIGELLHVSSSRHKLTSLCFKGLSSLDIIMISISYQLCLYILIRMARGGFTLGEAGLVAQTAAIFFMETVNLTKSRVRAIRFHDYL